MNPLHALVIVGLLVRLAVWFTKWAQGRPEGTSTRQRPVDWVALAWAASVLALASVTVLVTGPLGLIVALPVGALLLEPSPLATVLLPLGRPWLVWLPTRVSLVVWRLDRRGGADAMAARAAIAGGRVPEVGPVSGPVTTGTVVAAALSASAEGDRGEARALLEASAWFDAQPETLRAWRSEWLAAEGATRGDWAAVALLCDASGTDSARLRLLRGVALRLLDTADAPDAERFDALVRAAARERVAGLDPIVDRARGARHRSAFEAPPLPDRGLDGAFEAHRRALLDPAWLEAAADAWDAEELPDVLFERVLDDLSQGWHAAGRVPPDASGRVGAALADRFHRERMDALGAQARALAARLQSRRDLDPLSEVHEFAWFVHHFPLPATPPSGAAALRRRMAFRAFYLPVVDWSADLYNRRAQPYLFRAVTRWLIAQARIVGDGQAEAVLSLNLTVSTPFA